MRVTSAADVGALVRSERQKRGMSQREPADRIGVSAVWLSQVENGKATAHVGLVLRTLKELKMPLWVGPLPNGAKGDDVFIDLDSLVDP